MYMTLHTSFPTDIKKTLTVRLEIQNINAFYIITRINDESSYDLMCRAVIVHILTGAWILNDSKIDGS